MTPASDVERAERERDEARDELAAYFANPSAALDAAASARDERLRGAVLDDVEHIINSTVDIELSDYDVLRERIKDLRAAIEPTGVR